MSAALSRESTRLDELTAFATAMGVANPFPTTAIFRSLQREFRELVDNTEQIDRWLVTQIAELPQLPVPSSDESRKRLLSIALKFDALTVGAKRSIDRPVSPFLVLFHGREMRRLKNIWSRVYEHTGTIAAALRALATARVERLRWLDLLQQMPPEEVALLHVRMDGDTDSLLKKLDSD